MKSLKIGDNVSWSSQAGGFSKIKFGVVIAIVAAGRDPLECFPIGHNYGHDGFGMPRNHESYLVAIRGKRKQFKNRIYWPRVSNLVKVAVNMFTL